MTSIAGSLAASTASPPPPQRRCNTQVRPTTLPALPTFTPMAPFPLVGHMDTVGDRLAWDLAGRHSRMGNGSWILGLAGPGRAISRGAGLPIITEDGSSMPLAGAGFIPRRFFTDTRGIYSLRHRGSPGAFLP